VEPDQLPRKSRHLLRLPPLLESLPFKRRKVIKCGTHTSTYHTCDHTRMSTESSQKDTESPSNPIPTIVNSVPSTPSTTTVVVPTVPIITPIQPVVSTQPIMMNPFGLFFVYIDIILSPSLWPLDHFLMACRISHRSFYPPFQHLTQILVLGLGHVSSTYSYLIWRCSYPSNESYGWKPTSFHPWSNPGINTPVWSGQPSGQAAAYVLSFTPTSSTPILTNTFGMTNPPLSSGFTPGGGQFQTLGNPQPGATPTGEMFYNPHQNIPSAIIPNLPLMNHP